MIDLDKILKNQKENSDSPNEFSYDQLKLHLIPRQRKSQRLDEFKISVERKVD